MLISCLHTKISGLNCPEPMHGFLKEIKKKRKSEVFNLKYLNSWSLLLARYGI